MKKLVILSGELDSTAVFLNLVADYRDVAGISWFNIFVVDKQ